MFVCSQDPHPDSLVASTDPDADPALPFSLKSVQRTEIMPAKKFVREKFSC
jgi:hypothetical protein